MSDLIRTGVNDESLPKLIITDDNENFLDDDLQDELLEDKKWLKFKVVYPPTCEFMELWEITKTHMKGVWTCFETDLKSDIVKFKHAQQNLKIIVRNIIGLFLLGDTVVLDKLKGLNLTPNVIRMLLDNVTDRENTHQLTYSMWADILDDPNYVRSEKFVEEYLGSFKKIGEKYQHYTDNRVILFFIMVCEMIFFVPGFQVLCYLATTGYAPNLCNANMLVMRDEHNHYRYARTALATYMKKLDKKFALNILNDMIKANYEFIEKITSEANHEVLTKDHLNGHLNYVVHEFMKENLLYDSPEEELINDDKFASTPAWSYMFMLKYETKTNLMESVSTNYQIPGPVDSSIDMSMT